MVHSFDVEIAERYGLLEAVLLNNLYYWIEKNRANDVNFFDGTYWTYNSTRAFNELFPYVSERQIKNALKHLREEGILLTGNYNKSAYDRTLWYALSEKGLSIVQKCPMENTTEDNGSCNNVPPIPNNKPNIKPNDKPNNTYSGPEFKNSEPEQEPTEAEISIAKMNDPVQTESKLECMAAGDTVCRADIQSVVERWNELQAVGIKAVSRVSSGTKRYSSLIARIKQYGVGDVMKAIDRIRESDFLQGKNKNGWTITFDWFVLPNNFIKVFEGNYDNPPLAATVNRANESESLFQFAETGRRWAENE